MIFDWHGDELQRIVSDAMRQRLQTAGEVVRAAAVRSISQSVRRLHAGQGPVTRVRRGRRRAVIQRSRPGEPPRTDTGSLRKSVFLAVRHDRAYVGTPLRYGLYLEVGTVRMAPRPWLRPALINSLPRLQRIFAQPLPLRKNR